MALPARDVSRAAFRAAHLWRQGRGAVFHLLRAPVPMALLCAWEHSFGPCCTLSLGSGLAACLRPDSLLCLPFRAMDLESLRLCYLGAVLGCLVREGSRQVSGVRTASQASGFWGWPLAWVDGAWQGGFVSTLVLSALDISFV